MVRFIKKRNIIVHPLTWKIDVLTQYVVKHILESLLPVFPTGWLEKSVKTMQLNKQLSIIANVDY